MKQTNTDLMCVTQTRVIDFLKLIALLSGGGALLMASALISYISTSPTNTLLIAFLMIGVYLFSGTTAACVWAITVRINSEINLLASSNTTLTKAWKKSCRFAATLFFVSVGGLFILFYVYCDNVIREIRAMNESHVVQPQNPDRTKDNKRNADQKQPENSCNEQNGK